MKKTRIHFSQPFDEIVATVLSLPRAHGELFDNTSGADRDLKQILRGVYEAANGRQVETTLGLVAIAPPAVPLLKEAAFEVETQLEFLVEVIARLVGCPSELPTATSASEMIGHGNGDLDRVPWHRISLNPERVHLRPQGVSHG